MTNLHNFLIDYDMAMLRALAQNRGIALTTNRQVDAVDHLAVALADPMSVRTALARLSNSAREALDALLAANGRMRAPHFARRFGQVRPIGPGRLDRDASWQEPANPAEELWYVGLIFRAFAQDHGKPAEFVFIPDDLLPLLPPPRSGPPTFALEAVAAPANWVADEEALVADLFAYLVYLQTHDVRPYSDGRLGRRDLTALRQRLAESDEHRLTFLRHLAQRLGFVIRQGEYLRLEATPVKRWLAASPARQAAFLQEAWRDDPTWNDLCHVPGLICDPEPGWQNDPVHTRHQLLGLLAQCPPGAWWRAKSFVAAVKTLHPDFQRPDGDYMSWYIRDTATGEYLSGFETWNQVEGALIADLLARALHWLGVLVTSGEGPELACRLTEAGARFLGLVSEEPEAPSSLPIAIRPDFSIQVPGPANLYTRFQLERFAEFERADPCHYRLTVEGLSRGLARGIRLEQILAFLRQASEGAVPANVAGQLQVWAGRFGQVQLEEIALLQVKEERVLRELSVLPQTRAYIGKVLSPTLALVRKQDLPRLRKALRALGFLPPEDLGSDSVERG
jgi:hypothetical protein